MLIIDLGEIPSEVDAPAFPAFLGGLGDEQGDGEHVLAFPAFGRVKDFVHHVPLPEPYYLLRLCQRPGGPGDSYVSPHEGSKRVSHVVGVQTGAVRMRDLIAYHGVPEMGRS